MYPYSLAPSGCLATPTRSRTLPFPACLSWDDPSSLQHGPSVYQTAPTGSTLCPATLAASARTASSTPYRLVSATPTRHLRHAQQAFSGRGRRASPPLSFSLLLASQSPTSLPHRLSWGQSVLQSWPGFCCALRASRPRPPSATSLLPVPPRVPLQRPPRPRQLTLPRPRPPQVGPPRPLAGQPLPLRPPQVGLPVPLLVRAASGYVYLPAPHRPKRRKSFDVWAAETRTGSLRLTAAPAADSRGPLSRKS